MISQAFRKERFRSSSNWNKHFQLVNVFSGTEQRFLVRSFGFVKVKVFAVSQKGYQSKLDTLLTSTTVVSTLPPEIRHLRHLHSCKSKGTVYRNSGQQNWNADVQYNPFWQKKCFFIPERISGCWRWVARHTSRIRKGVPGTSNPNPWNQHQKKSQSKHQKIYGEPSRISVTPQKVEVF